jgi:hypothetical protein
MAGLVPTIPLRLSPCPSNRNHRDSAQSLSSGRRTRAGSVGAGPVMTIGEYLMCFVGAQRLNGRESSLRSLAFQPA